MRVTVQKPRLQQTIEIVWGDWLATYRGVGPQYLRLEATGETLTITGNQAEASFPAEVIEAGVLFIRAAIFDEVLCRCADLASEKATIQSDGCSIRINGLEHDLDEDDALLFDDVSQAPAEWSGEVPADEELDEMPLFPAETPIAPAISPPKHMTDVQIRQQLAWAIEIIRRRFSQGLEEICNPRFLSRRYTEFESRNDPIYADLLKGMEDEALAKTFVSYWTIAHTLATKSRFWLEDAIAEIIIHQARKLGRKATHVYSHSMLAAGQFQEKVSIEQLGENYREQLTDRRPWRPSVQTSALEKVDVIVGQQERERKPERSTDKPFVRRTWDDEQNRGHAAKDAQCLADIASVFLAAGVDGREQVPDRSEVTMQCNLLVVEPDKCDGTPHVWAFRFVNPKTVSNHAARKQERVNLLRLYALLVQEKPLRDWKSIHVSLAELLPRYGEFDAYDHYPDYFSANTYWSCDKVWEFIGVPFRVVTLAIQDVAKEFRDRLKAGLRDLLPGGKPPPENPRRRNR